MAMRVVVTGGGTGIGRAVAQRFVRDGASVVLVGRRAEVLEDTASDLRAMSGAEVRTASADLRSPDAVAGLASDITGAGPVDALVLNAGGNFGQDGDSADEVEQLTRLAQAYRADFDGNVVPTVLLGEALLPYMTRPGGRVVAISSVAGLRGAGSYGAAKAAVNAWVWDASMRVAAEGVTVNAVAPGYVPDTEFWTERLKANPGLEASRLARIPMARAGTPLEVAEAVAYFASGGAGWTTGQILQVNGGTLLGHG
jgi:3-oxoacyl-[acyl-carrier protein] reductase